MLASQTFQNPGNEFRVQPFWFWNGEMDEEQIAFQIAEMAKQGVGGFFICARQGLTIPYLSQAWFDKVKVAVSEAKKYGLHVWLYDEYPYPSGMAGGEVTLEMPEAKQRTLEHYTKQVSSGSKVSWTLPWAVILYAKAIRLGEKGNRLWEETIDLRKSIGNVQLEQVYQETGLTSYNRKRFFTYETAFQLEWDPPAGEWEILIFMEEEIRDFKYYGNYVDPMNEKAMKRFIELTHERYEAELGEEFGGVIKGIFTDEIAPLGRIPWSSQLPAFFKSQNGYDLLEHLPALICRDARDAARIRYDYFQSVHLLLRQSVHKQAHDFCERTGIQYAAEVPSVRMTTQLYSHLPGGDSAHEKIGRSLSYILDRYGLKMRDNPKMVSSLARQLGRKRNMIECFHSVGWSMTLQDAKWMIDRMAALGTNFYNFHAFFYTIGGLAKHDAPPSQFVQNPYWPYFRELGDYVGRISYLMSEGYADIRIAVLDPTTSFWTLMGNPLHGFSYAGVDEEEKEELELLKQEWLTLSTLLLKHRRDYDHLDPELLASSTVDDGKIRIGEACYDVLILPPLNNLEAEPWQKLSSYVQAGGKVISIGRLPNEIIQDASPAKEQIAALLNGENARFIRTDESLEKAFTREVLPLLDRWVPEAVALEIKEDPLAVLQQIRWISNHQALLFVTNQEGEPISANLRIDAEEFRTRMGKGDDSQGQLYITMNQISLETGSENAAAALTPLYSETNSLTGYERSIELAPYEARAYLIDCKPEAIQTAETVTVSNRCCQEVLIPLSGTWELTAAEENKLRLGEFSLTVMDADGKVHIRGAEVTAKPFIDQVAKWGSEGLPIRFNQVFGTPKQAQLAYPLYARYVAEFDCRTKLSHGLLFFDRHAISGEYTLDVNGRRLTGDEFMSVNITDHNNIAANIGAYLYEGINKIVVEVRIEKDDDGLLDPLMLSGSFGVYYVGEQLVLDLPEQTGILQPEPVEGYPYYAGTMRYRRTFMYSAPAIQNTDKFELTFDDFRIQDVVELRVNGHSLGVRAWSPYQWTGSTNILKDGENEIEVSVTGTLIGLLEGTYFDQEEHGLRNVKECYRKPISLFKERT
ncbi:MULTISPECIES: glycosyl hydrolase [unclassified Paenibacillus]|uniref:Glycosyl hydrolase n=1 Tax=Paenibacillus provencensis TaxID=441151 RepID=A0ABW3QAA2_9BACL|nr:MULTISPECIES: glycosyl hydrolase [unclassified Paenibacillus]MCM3129895.1 hypothetical protein [Paenibacillus sp. MER 78]SFS91084.1 hypothetical protein SAMN04488601_10719 [Paenibacillus sp. 453mf]